MVSSANEKPIFCFTFILSSSVNLKSPENMKLKKPSCIKKYSRSKNCIFKIISLSPKLACHMDHLHWWPFYVFSGILQADDRYWKTLKYWRNKAGSGQYFKPFLKWHLQIKSLSFIFLSFSGLQFLKFSLIMMNGTRNGASRRVAHNVCSNVIFSNYL